MCFFTTKILEAIIISIFSSLLYDEIKSKIDKRQINKLKKDLIKWANTFEKENKNKPIVISGRFYPYIKDNKLIPIVMDYVLGIETHPESQYISEQKFILEQKRRVVENLKREQLSISTDDEDVIEKFFKGLIDSLKKSISDKMKPQEKLILYAIFQTRHEISELREELKQCYAIIGHDLSNILKVIEEIRDKIYEGQLILSNEWFVKQNKSEIANLGTKYSIELNVQLDMKNCFRVISKNRNFNREFINYANSTLTVINILSYEKDSDIKELCKKLSSKIEQFVSNLSGESDIKEITDIFKDINEKTLKYFENIKQGKDKEGEEYSIRKAMTITDSFISYLNSDEIKTLFQPYMLITGYGGIGKSHLIADMVEDRNKNGEKSILFLGQHFSLSDEPLRKMLELSGLSSKYSSEEFLEHLNKRGSDQGSRLIIFIDAINEGCGIELWKNHLAGIIEKLKNYPWIGLVLSIRTSYKYKLFEENNLKEKLIEIEHRGFRSTESEAIKKYFKHYKISLTKIAPIVNSEFSNPLFLKLFCKAYKNREIDIDKIHFTDVYKNYIKKMNYKIAEACEKSSLNNFDFLNETLEKLVEIKYIKKSNFIFLKEASKKIIEIEKEYKIGKDLLTILINNGILTRNIQYDYKKHEEYVYVTYERIEDYIYAEKISAELKQVGRDTFLSNNEKELYDISILEMLAIILPEENDYELFEIFTDDNINITEAFIYGLLWRKPETIKDKAFGYINFICNNKYLLTKLFDVLITLSTREKHPLNAYRTDKLLRKLKMPDRDKIFIEIFDYIFTENDSSIDRLISWAQFESHTGLDEESARLAAIMLSWFLISTHNILRDRATRALVNLLSEHIPILISILSEFQDIDDPYILERLYAAAFGCVVRSSNISEIEKLAIFVYNTIFNVEMIYPNILLRDYAKNIVEYALHKIGKIEEIDSSKILPPYKSDFPEVPTTNEIDDFKIKEKSLYYCGQNEILHSMRVDIGGAGYGDFGRYTFQSYFKSWRQLNPIALQNNCN